MEGNLKEPVFLLEHAVFLYPPVKPLLRVRPVRGQIMGIRTRVDYPVPISSEKINYMK